MLDYATQVSELEKIARLSPPRAIERDAPALLPPHPAARCLVCGKRPARPCSACGGVSYCGVEHQRADARFHDAVCDALRTVAEDQRAAEKTPELVAALLTVAAEHSDPRALRGWDDLLGAQSPIRRRRMSDLATRPLTLASALATHEPRATWSVHVIAASQRELEVPAELWALAERLVGARIELSLVGPELPHRSRSALRTKRALYGRALWSELGRPDLVIGYDAGLVMYPTWRPTLVELRGSGVPLVLTTFRDWEVAAETRLLSALGASCLRPATANPWASLMAKRSSTLANDVSYDNAYVSVWE